MKPKSPFTQAYKDLPDTLPVYSLENALLPGGELPLELAEANDIAMFFDAIKADQLIGMVQPDTSTQHGGTYQIGCAGRIRQYRERKDGRLNVMLTGVCRYRIVDMLDHEKDYQVAQVDWSGYERDYLTEQIEADITELFRDSLKRYFDKHRMQVDWPTLDRLPIEEVANNLVLVMNLTIAEKQRLLESATVSDRLKLFSVILEHIDDPIVPSTTAGTSIN